MPWPERTFRDSAKSSDEWRKEQTTTGEAKPPLTGEVPQTTPAGLDTVDPTIHSEPDSVCPPGCFWLSLDQDYSSSQLSVLQLCANSLCCFTKHIWNKARQNEQRRGYMWIASSLFLQDALMCVCGVAAIYSKRKLEALVHDTDAHLTHL